MQELVNTESIKKLSDELMAKIIGRTSITNNQLHDGLRLATNVETDGMTRFKTFELIAIFGSYFIQQKILHTIKLQDREVFRMAMRESYGSYVAAFYNQTNIKGFVDEILIAYDIYFKEFSNTVGSVNARLQKLLVLCFNVRSKIKFVDNSLSGKFKFGLVNTLLKTSYRAKVEKGVVSLPLSVSVDLATAITKDFLDIELV